jgi:hypothetical protein
MPQDGQKTIAEITKKELGKLQIFGDGKLFTIDAEEYHCNSRYLTDLLVSDVDRNM